ncbi:MAG: DUF4912 domain-containing protein [Treponema sp.]|nr:DUF4912 domain-containing protein [Treponema sp.]
MESMNFSRSYLETLSSADLIKLADEHGIDIPDDLNRRFIIGELLDLSQEMMAENHSEMLVVDNPGPEEGYLPISYNETEIDVVLRIPAWAYVWWDISEADFKKATEARGFKNFVLRLSYFDSEQSNVPSESFDIHISLEDREKFVLLSADKKYFRIDLVALYASKENDNLAISRKVRIPNENRIALNAIPGRELDISEVNKISGMERLLKSHYNNYRQSFAG